MSPKPGAGRRRPASNQSRAIATRVDGVYFGSRKEARRWAELSLLARGGVIRDLRRQVPYNLATLTPDGAVVVVGKWIADFQYFEVGRGPAGGPDPEIWEDSKGLRTEIFELKRRWFEAQSGLRMRIT